MRLKIGFLLLLCPFLRGLAQGVKVMDGGLKVGDRVPAGVLAEGLRGRLVLLDFWATWCAPCRAMVPRLDSLQRVFRGNLLVLPVAYESAAVTAPVEAAMKKRYKYQFEREISGDTVLGRLFPHRSLPHFVWLGGDGRVLAITEDKEVTAGHVRALLAGQGGLAAKRDVVLAYDRGRPLLVNGNGGDGASLRYHSLLTGYVPGLPAGLEITAFDSVRGQQFSVRNAPLVWLYRLAFGERGRVFPAARLRLLSRDSLKLDTRLAGQAYHDWLAAGNGWCYELVLPPGLKDPFGLIRGQLALLFPAYRAEVDTERVRSLVLVRTGTTELLRTGGGVHRVEIGPYTAHLRNARLGELLGRLERQYLQLSALPLADGTGYAGKVDLDLDCALSDVAALNRALAPYGLALVEQLRPAELLVIRDTN